jgi:glycosyltransferase involved in cell wall biosynthesis
MGASECPFVLHTRIVSGVGGGPEKTILNSPRFLRELGYRAACLYLYPPGDSHFDVVTQRAARADAELIGVPDGAPVDFGIVRQLQDLCRRRGVTIWHAHDYKTNFLGLLVRRRWPMKLVTTLHGWGVWSWKSPLYNTVGKACLRYYDAVVSVSQDLYDDSLRWRVAPERAHLIHNAIDTGEYRRTLDRSAARRQLGIAGNGLAIAALGRLSAEKGFDALIDCVAMLRSRGMAITLWIGGEGACRNALQRQIARLKLEDTVLLRGHVADPQIMLQAADIFVLSSLREGLPNAVLEAMALETPVIATRVAGVPSVITHGEHGLLVDIGDTGQLADAIARLATDAGLRARLAHAGRQRIEQSYDFRERMRKMARVYDLLLRTALPTEDYQ